MPRTLRHLPLIGLLGLPLAGASLVGGRAMLIADAASSYGVPWWQWVLSVVAHDALLLGLLGVATAIAFIVPRTFSPLPACAGLALIVLMLADLLVFQQLAHRLLYSDLIKFRKEIGALASLIRVNGADPRSLAYLVAGSAGIAVLLASLWPQARRRPSFAKVLAVVGVGALMLFAVRDRVGLRSIHAEYVMNVIEVNANNTVDRPYSAAFGARVRASAAQPLACSTGRGKRVDIILVVVESLSAYQSELLGGPLAITPHLDDLATGGTWFTGMLANGFTTDHGLIALLTGRNPIPGIGRYGSLDAYAGFEAPEGSLPRRLSRSGYSSAFLANSDLSFLGKGAWLKGLGFDDVEGHDHPFYTGAPRGHFQAAPDGWLFDRALHWLDSGARDSPRLLVLATTSTHPPFTNPVTGERSEAASFGYLDERIGAFARSLKDRGFFDNGLVLITSDHRSMTPLRPGELDRFGEFAPARIPLIVLGADILPAGPVSGTYQQTDLAGSLDALVSDTACRPAQTGLLFASPPQPPDSVVHSRGDLRNRLEVFVADQAFGFRLAGDDSDWVGPRPPGALAHALPLQIHRERIERGLGSNADGLLDYYIQQRLPPDPVDAPR